MPNPMESYWDTDQGENEMSKALTAQEESKWWRDRQIQLELKKLEAEAKKLKEENKAKVYFSPAGFVCECGQLMTGGLVIKNGKRLHEIFCPNINCPENLVSKYVELPVVECTLVDPTVA